MLPHSGSGAQRPALVFALLTLGLCSAEPGSADTLRNLTAEEGLSHAAVYGITQGSEGLMWFGTEGGLDRFDGYRVSRVGRVSADGSPLLPSVSDLLTDRQGRLWIASWGYGLLMHDPGSDETRHYRHDPEDPGSIGDDRVQALYEDADGVVWSGGLAGLYRADPRTLDLTPVQPESGLSHLRIWDMVRGPGGDLWVATSNGVDRLNLVSEAVVERLQADGSERGLNHPEARAVAVGPDGGVWIGTRDGLHRYDPLSGRLYSYFAGAEPNALADDKINELLVDSRGTLWVGSNRGLHRYLPAVDGFEPFPRGIGSDSTLIGANVRSTFEDRSGLLWVGTRDRGVFVVDTRLRRFDRLLDENIEAIAVDGETLWLGTLDGLLRVAPEAAPERWRKGDPKGPADDIVLSLALDPSSRRLWVGSYEGLTLLGVSQAQPEALALPGTTPDAVRSGAIDALLIDEDRRLWIGYRGGLYRWDETLDTWEDPARGALAGYHIRTLRQDRSGDVWVGTDTHGLCRLGSTDDRLSCYDNDPDDSRSLSDDRVFSLWEDDEGRLFVGTELALHLMVRPGEFERYGPEIGLPRAAVHGILGDGEYLWTSSALGIARFDPTTRETVRFGSSDGLPPGGFTDRGAARGPDGQLYFGGIAGLARFDPGEVSTISPPPRLAWTGARIGGRVLSLGPFAPRLDLLQIEPDERYFEVHFAVLDYTDPSRNQYRYRLEGAGEGWVDLGGRHQAAFTGLAPGRYELQVQGANSEGTWAAGTLSLPILVRPQVWATGWFRSLTVVLVLLAALLTHRRRLWAIRRQAVELERIVERRTEEVRAEREQAEHRSRRQSLLNDLVRLINEEVEAPELLRAILEATSFMERAEAAAALVARDDGFEIAAVSGMGTEHWPQATIPRTHMLAHLAAAREIAPGVFVGPPLPTLAPEGEPTTVFLRVSAGETLQGFVLLSGRDLRCENDLDDLVTLQAHATSAFVKARMLGELRQVSDQKSELLGLVAHDLRSPLGAVSGFADLLLRHSGADSLQPERVARYARRVRSGLDQVLKLVDDLLDVAAIETGRLTIRPEATRFADLFADREALYRERAAAKEIELTLEAERTVAWADPERTAEVLDNLVGNAIKFTPRGGRVRVSAHQGPSGVTVEVEDSGIGLEPGELDLLFTGAKLSARPTEGEPSSGFGLMIVKKLVEAQGGTVSARSRKGQGTTVSFTLPTRA